MGHRGTWGIIQQISSSSLFCRRPLWAVLAWAWMSTLFMLSIQFFLCRPYHCPPSKVPWSMVLERLVWCVTCPNHTSFCLWQLSEEVPVHPRGSWSCSAPSYWSCGPSRRCGKVSLGTWFRRLGSFSQLLPCKSWNAYQEPPLSFASDHFCLIFRVVWQDSRVALRTLYMMHVLWRDYTAVTGCNWSNTTGSASGAAVDYNTLIQ